MKNDPKHTTIEEKLLAEISEAVGAVMGDTSFNTVSIYPTLEKPADETHGDLATTVTLQIFSAAKKNNLELTASNPRQLGEQIAKQLRSQLDAKDLAVEAVEVAGPGFVNFRLRDEYFLSSLHQIVKADFVTHFQSRKWKNKKVFVEFTDPNPFKQLHIGHAYSNSVGESITRLLDASGADVYQANYQGDVGMHVSKALWGLQQMIATDLNIESTKLTLDQVDAFLTKLEKEKSPTTNTTVKKDSLVSLLGKAYAGGATAYKEDKQIQQEIKEINFLTYLSAQNRLVEEENWTPQIDYAKHVTVDDETFQKIQLLYQTGRRWSLEYFEIMYGDLGMRKKDSGKYFDHYFFESVVGEYGFKIVQEFLKKGIFEKSDGAVIFPGKKYGLHDRVFINSLGLPTYEAKELGLMPEKYTKVPYDYSIIITGNEIDEYFKVLLKALSFTNPELQAKTRHMSHGMVRLPEGKMSSRTGNVITVQDVLEHTEAVIAEKLNERSDLEAGEKESIAKKVGLGALKYAFLKHAIGEDIAFDFEQSLSFSGQSGPYLQYTYVRCISILEQAGDNWMNESVSGQASFSESELSLMKQLSQYRTVIEESVDRFAPHTLAHYLFELAQAFSVFYTNCPILKEEDQSVKQLRLRLTAATAKVLQHGLSLLGIETVEQM